MKENHTALMPVCPTRSGVASMLVSSSDQTAEPGFQEAGRECSQSRIHYSSTQGFAEEPGITCVGCAAAAVMLLKLTWKATCGLALLPAWPREG